MDTIADLPVAVIGAGPVGLAAAAQLISRVLKMKVYKAARMPRPFSRERIPGRFSSDAACDMRSAAWFSSPGAPSLSRATVPVVPMLPARTAIDSADGTRETRDFSPGPARGFR